MILPHDTADVAILAENTTWQYIYGFPILLYFLLGAGFTFFVKTDTPKFYLLKGDRKMAARAVKATYEVESE